MSWQAYAAPEYVVWFSCLCYIFALTSMSLSERPFLDDIMGASLKIWFSNGCSCQLNLILFRRSKHWRRLPSTNSNPQYLLFPSQTTPWSILTKQQSGVKLEKPLTYSELFSMLSQLVLMPGLLTRLARLVMMLEWHRLVLVWPQVSSTVKLQFIPIPWIWLALLLVAIN